MLTIMCWLLYKKLKFKGLTPSDYFTTAKYIVLQYYLSNQYRVTNFAYKHTK